MTLFRIRQKQYLQQTKLTTLSNKPTEEPEEGQSESEGG